MRDLLLNLARLSGGVFTRADARELVADHVLDDATAAGAVVRLFPQVYADAATAADLDVRRRAALRYVEDGALSHLDALGVWGLPCDPRTVDGREDAPAPIHVTTAALRPAMSTPGITLHRRKDFVLGSPLSVVRNDLRVVRLEQAVVESWPLLDPLCRRAPAIVAVRDRRTTSDRLTRSLATNRGCAGAAEMRDLFAALADGCHSELELWGHAQVFTHSSLPRSRGQVRIVVDGRTMYLDRVFDEEMVNVELDGAAYHGRPGQRERDLRRDALVARVGYLTVRYSHPRLHASPAEVRAELTEILAIRRRQLGLAAG